MSEKYTEADLMVADAVLGGWAGKTHRIEAAKIICTYVDTAMSHCEAQVRAEEREKAEVLEVKINSVTNRLEGAHQTIKEKQEKVRQLADALKWALELVEGEFRIGEADGKVILAGAIQSQYDEAVALLAACNDNRKG